MNRVEFEFGKVLVANDIIGKNDPECEYYIRYKNNEYNEPWLPFCHSWGENISKDKEYLLKHSIVNIGIGYDKNDMPFIKIEVDEIRFDKESQEIKVKDFLQIADPKCDYNFEEKDNSVWLYRDNNRKIEKDIVDILNKKVNRISLGYDSEWQPYIKVIIN